MSTGESGVVTYDREYTAAHWAAYFAQFVGNGVFANPTNQLMVVANEGLDIFVRPGWAWLNGYWYHNDEDLTISVPANTSTSVKNYGVFVHWDSNERVTKVTLEEHAEPLRTTTDWELKLAGITVPAGTARISDSMITDTRPDSGVCGFVSGVIELTSTTDLFRQYNAMFNEWYSSQTADFDAWYRQKTAEFEAWYSQQTSDYETWTAEKQQAFEDWFAQQDSDYQTWFNAKDNEFKTWFATLQNTLSGDVAANLQNEIDDLQNQIDGFVASTVTFSDDKKTITEVAGTKKMITTFSDDKKTITQQLYKDEKLIKTLITKFSDDKKTITQEVQ